MVKQERAVRTRASVMSAAAAAFQREGYDRSSLARISKASGMSVGAVTFHFSSKEELANAVDRKGRSVTLTTVEQACAEPGTALRRLIGLTLHLARLMEEDLWVSAAIRLARERPQVPAWSAVWLPTVNELLDLASENGELRAETPVRDVATLVEHLTAGAEVHVMYHRTDDDHESTVERMARLWCLILRGFSVDPSGVEPVTG
ncbi:TetR/AcrR family transcriptional regulator [Streptomyces alkaliphilus]|uniref:TetR/AcrR family transcriptional regulator n=1 Tax=Streptomyces alkaliphilus TaxID=1472722 RepID=UPI00129642CE|nr:TetR/AcrR family transcriptional regulator [Streptomyces alkaliphilus]